MIGNTLSHYQIIEKLDQGGMVEVYPAEDSPWTAIEAVL